MHYIENVDKRFQEMLTAVMRRGSSGDLSASRHLDEDTLAAFASGFLTEREMLPAVEHIADCGLCRRTTAELIRLDAGLADAGPVPLRGSAADTAGIGEAISSWFSRLFGTGEAGVFAHGERDDDDSSEQDKGHDTDADPKG